MRMIEIFYRWDESITLFREMIQMLCCWNESMPLLRGGGSGNKA